MGAMQSAASGFSPTHSECSPQVKGPRSTQSDDRHRKRLDFPDAEAVAAGAAAIHMSPHCFRAVGCCRSCGSSRLAAGVLMQVTAYIG